MKIAGLSGTLPTRPVTVTLGDESFRLHLRHPTAEERLAFTTGELMERREPSRAGMALVSMVELICGWDDIQDEKGKPVPFSTDARARLIASSQPMAVAVGVTLMRWVRGMMPTEGEEKKSAGSPEDTSGQGEPKTAESGSSHS